MSSEKAAHVGDGQPALAAKREHNSYSIHIDNQLCKVEEATRTGAQLRQLPTPSIGPERKLIEVVPGPGMDKEISDDDVVGMREGQHFVSTPRNVTPGAGDGG